MDSCTLQIALVRKCTALGKENGVSKSVLFADHSRAIFSTRQDELLGELMAEKVLIKLRRDKYTVTEDSAVIAKYFNGTGRKSLADHVAKYKNHIIEFI